MGRDREFLLVAFDEAEKVMVQGTYPIGAIVVEPEGEVVGMGTTVFF